jgi:glycosyltransferase involved in cell wall biosynthesis
MNSKPSIEIAFVAFNRIGYTRLALESLLADSSEEFDLSIWDNGSTDGTRDYLEGLNDPRIVRKVLSQKNLYITGAANEIFSQSKADLLAIVPDDFLTTPGWTRPLASVHAEVPEAGLVSCWFLGKEFFDEERAGHKIQAFGKHRILRHPWTGGGAALFKRNAWEEAGRFDGIGTPDCWLRMATRGYVNGFYVPPIFVEHMDDPWSPYYCGTVSEIRKRRGTATDQQAWLFHLAVVREVLAGPWEAKYYTGWRGDLRIYANRFRRKLVRLGLVGHRPLNPVRGTGRNAAQGKQGQLLGNGK